MRMAILIGAALVAASTPALAEDPAQDCAASALRTGECLTVHGRLTTCTGVPNARIWVIGSKRLLGVTDAAGSPAGEHLLPGRLEDEMFSATPCSKAAFGDFTVCPLTPDRPGVMRRVCVVGATNVRILDW